MRTNSNIKQKIVQNELNVRGMKFKCWVCDNVFNEALYWFDSLYFANFDERIIKIFCGPKCVQEWHEKNNVRDWPDRKPPYPKGDEWKPTQHIV